MLNTPEFLRKSAENCGFVREAYDESKIPTSVHNVVVLPFFGDIRGSAVLSTFILKRYKEELKGSKYFILCSWPGYKVFYPYIDEFWSIRDKALLSEFFSEAHRFSNTSNIMMNFMKELNQCFYEVLSGEDLETFYNNGITDNFMLKFKSIRRFLPLIPSKGILNTELNRAMVNRSGYKILVYPLITGKSWRHRLENIKLPKAFWIALIKRLHKEGFVPVVVQNNFTHDLHREVEGAIPVQESDFSKIMSIMRATDCVLDIFTDVSRFATIARTPYVACVERTRYIYEKDYEFDDLCGEDLPKQYIFCFSTILERGSSEAWELNIFDNLMIRLKTFLPTITSEMIPSASEVDEEVSYKDVRVRKLKRFGTKFIKVPRDG